jgi:hypothetical protein
MIRGAAQRCGFVSLMLLAAGAFGTLGGGSPAQAATTLSESHAPRIAIPIPIPGHGGIRATPAPVQWEARNWSGYAINSGTYTSVSGSWTVPTVIAPTTHPSKSYYSSTWVGIDGFINTNLIQAGTEEDWIGGSAHYDSWWEILPSDEIRINSIAVNPGDVMTVSITQGNPLWTITVTDTTNGQAFTTNQAYSGQMSSAEWIQEAPTVGDRVPRVARLADDGTVVFDNCLANGVNPDFTFSDSGFMAKRGGRDVISTPSPPNPEGNGFAVAFGKHAPPAPPD